ncbi:MAG: hypothetical protein ISR59_10910 [Anaerolineales bacterium]|uniref:Radical SAM protein n=1 Tax=Candidatus Desulfolinea nitratireducens TaxID=2841698 RepID=A0A8J6NHZ7_9CHLR|nr:hypothetical protein [Candidatus Desulfolinea nitratireducens]MBL6961609.1 hypothetical protein [Anaerolineales bacterium]
MSIFDSVRDFFTPARPLPAGVLHFQSPEDDEVPYRLHLRMHGDGSSLLVVNASTVLHLNPTATEYAYHFIKGTDENEAAEAVSKRYHVKAEQALQDYQIFSERIDSLVHTEDVDPVSYLGFDRVAPHSTGLTAPLRLDCALTYELPKGASADDAPTKRVDRELATAEWTSILDKAWAAGIPHVTFTGGEPTLREDLPELIAYAEEKGMVSGLLSDGLKLANAAYLNTLLQTGLDHLLFLLQSEKKKSWQALEAIMPADLFTTVHLTITEKNADNIGETLEKLAALEVTSLSLTCTPDQDETLLSAREQAARLGISLTWDLPVPYSAHHPITLETTKEHFPDGAGKVWLYVEPDGDVLPMQGMPDQILGNFLHDDWASIWKNK